MGNRGSKSIVLNAYIPSKDTIQESIVVKEQRVRGSWRSGYAARLRYTLTGFERNYPIRIPSVFVSLSSNGVMVTGDQVNIYTRRYYTSKVVQQCPAAYTEKPNSDVTINPWFITGFTDGEGCFFLSI
jgi:hypothetical protein